jgi:flavin-dependent dehydrogenase
MTLRPAPSFVLDQAGGEGWLAAGDAGSAHDPLSAQGIFKALSEGIEAGNVIADAGAQQMSGWKEKEYDARLQQRFETYRANRAYFYGLEQRWPDSEFWSRRKRSKSTESI